MAYNGVSKLDNETGVGKSKYINPLDIEIQKAAKFTIDKLNSGGTIRDSLTQIKGKLTFIMVQSAYSQIVSGVLYNLSIIIIDNTAKTYTINVKVWCKPWLDGYSKLSSPSWELTKCIIN